MSQAQLLEIEKTLLSTLTTQELKDFVFDLIQKASQRKTKQKNVLPSHIKQGIGESLEAYERGEYRTLKTKQELFDHFEKLSH